MKQQQKQAGITIFYSYAREDEALCQTLEKHLILLEREGLIEPWHDRDIQAGTEWKQEIDEHLNTADLILLLISPDFLASDYCYEYEMQRAIERHQRGQARVIPVILRPCSWRSAPFGALQALPRDGRAIIQWDNQDAAFLDVEQNLRAQIEQLYGTRHPPVSSSAATKNRVAMLQRLKRTYQDLLTSSLRETTWIELGLAEQPGAVPNAPNLYLHQAEQPVRPLPCGTSVLQVYREANQELLILGAPGAGKSTLLYQLGRDLLAQATSQPTAPLPVLFPLSSWAQKRLPLGHWMVEQLVSPWYSVPREQSQQWVENGQILPLLDGLDEVEKEARPVCIAAINAYRNEHLCPLVVCSRSAEYMVASIQKQGRLHLESAIEVQPLSEAQLDAALVQAGAPFAALQSELKTNSELRALARTPLWLNVLLLTFKNTPIPTLSQQHTALQRQVCERYVQRMIEEKGQSERYPLEQTKRWLSWLAGQVRERNLSEEFAVEMLNPDWLARGPQAFYRWSSMLVSMLVIVLISWLVNGLVGGLVIELVFGLIGLAWGILRQGLEVTVKRRIRLLKERFEEKITRAERFIGFWEEARSGLVNGLVGGLVLALVNGLVGGLTLALVVWLIVWLVVGLVVGLVDGLVARLVIWISSGWLYLQQYLDHYIFASAPGKILRVAFRQGLVVWLVVWLAVWLVLALVSGLEAGKFMWSWKEARLELVAGLIAGWLSGWSRGLRVVRHLPWRFWLWLTGLFPFRAVAFLEDACACHLLQRIGGRYRFVHRLLLDYFATLDEPALRRAITIREQLWGADHLYVAESLSKLAQLYQEQEKYVEMEPLLLRLLAILEQQLGPQHPNTAACLSILATVYRQQGKYAQAEPLYKRFLMITEQQLGADHPDTACSMYLLAGLYDAQGKYAEAEPLQRRALAIREQQLGPEHPDVADSSNSLALLYYHQGEYDQAELLYKHALRIREQHLGLEHPHTATSLNGLADLYQAQGKYEQAEPLMVHALATREQKLGSEHAATAESLNSLADLYRAQGKYEQAEPLYKLALRIREQSLGLEHPIIAASLNGLANLYQAKGEYEQAESLYKHALAIREQRLGATHPKTQETRKGYVALLRLIGRDREAKKLKEEL
jgi:tetratricopeptide (TPR) repeat protein